MCDEQTEKDNDRYLEATTNIDRRTFTKLTALTTIAAAFPQFAAASTVVENKVSINTQDGTVDAYFYHPNEGKHPAVIMWPDIKGLRPAFQAMARRLAGEGYAVLVVNPFYRSIVGKPLPKGVSFPSPEAWKILRPLRQALTTTAINTDTGAFIEFLDGQSAVDTARSMGVQGYCMSGVFAMQAAADFEKRVGAIASFHGGGLATSESDSPHLNIKKGQAPVLHAIAENDDEKAPEAKGLLREAYAKAGIAAEIEVYEGAMHGWCPPDSRVYNEVQAEKAWSRLLALYKANL
jgi:carboxymethylenebutenolidase